ncbi:MAG: Tn7 transposase TnsA N-terminal domain-containing protein [Clostridia bacterium]|nr:Tn7 transposase TnsA N-terminal domain-containing protein [Clostridia bacterium]
MPRKTENGKLREGRGTGIGADYKPWIKIREVNSIGTASTVIDYKTGRPVELLSQGEVYYYYILRWDDTVEDIREQFPLELDRTLEIADKLRIKHPHDRSTRMTTDLLITRTNGTLEAYSIKTDRSVLENERTIQKLRLEQAYWETQGVAFYIRFKDEVNKTYVQNIMDVVSCYDIQRVQTRQDLIRYQIAHKTIQPDMKSKLLDYIQLQSLLERGHSHE